ncbi:MAG: Hsp20/alpha crystallin family protein [Actinomycetota bacterium]|nr:Hsp20/alpha crystallin family protein [Actinomycetota bacterium]
MHRRKDLKDELDELFADLWHVSRLSGLRRRFRPQLDCFLTDDPPTFTVLVDIAGIDPDAVHIATADRSLVIVGERRRDDCGGRTYQHMEIEYGPFERAVQLPEHADTAAAEASYDRGLLRIVIPIAKPTAIARAVPIEIRREG